MAEKTHCSICDRNFKDHDGLLKHNQSIHYEKTQITKSKNASYSKLILGIIILVIISLFFFSFIGISPDKYENFAKCMTQSGAKMYGAYWCTHCSEQKALFGASWKNINYIECSLPNKAGQTQECISAGIESYPTWEIGGKRFSGAKSPESLSELSGCPIN